MTDYNQYISHEELVEVFIYMCLNRNDPYAKRVAAMKICEVNEKGIQFGLPNLPGTMIISWKRFLAVNQLLKSSLN